MKSLCIFNVRQLRIETLSALSFCNSRNNQNDMCVNVAFGQAYCEQSQCKQVRRWNAG